MLPLITRMAAIFVRNEISSKVSEIILVIEESIVLNGYSFTHHILIHVFTSRISERYLVKESV